ncbi:hypothetical protein D9M71_542860 [compost metagenome]
MWNVLAQQDAGQGEQVPGDVEGQAHPQGIPAVELLLVVLAGQGEEFVGQQKAQAQAPAQRLAGQYRAHRQAIQQVLRGQQQGGEQDRRQVGTPLEHANGHQLRGAGEDDGRQPLPLPGAEVGLDGHGTGQQAPRGNGEGQRENGDGAVEEGLAGDVGHDGCSACRW